MLREGDTSSRASVRLLIGVIGDFDPAFPPHPATTAALEHAAVSLSVEIEVRWLATPELRDVAPEALEAYDALWCAPGSPYRSLDGALRAVRLARERGWPLLGTCGGFQHMVIEFARNVLGIQDAQHAEYDPYASRLVVAPLTCSLAGRTMSVRLVPGSRVGEIYGTPEVTEHYYCNFGLNPDYQDELDAAGLRVVGRDQDGEARIVELPDHPLYVATLFVPQLNSRPGRAHPLAVALLEAASDRARRSKTHA
jgi:CTP synthase (UTP-ammonia lyase)